MREKRERDCVSLFGRKIKLPGITFRSRTFILQFDVTISMNLVSQFLSLFPQPL